MNDPVPMIRSQRVRDFLAWSDTLAPGELMRTFRTSPFADLTPAELDQARRWQEDQADASLAEAKGLAAQAAELIVQRLLREARDGT